MRGDDLQQSALFSYVSPEQRGTAHVAQSTATGQRHRRSDDPARRLGRESEETATRGRNPRLDETIGLMLDHTADNAAVQQWPHALRECNQREVFHPGILNLL